MATTTSLGYTDKISTPKQIAIPDLDYEHDFAIAKDDADTVVLTNVTSPVDQPELIRFGYQNVNNVYTGTGIDPSFVATTKRGVSLVAQVNDIMRVTTDGDGCCGQVYDLPLQAHVVLKLPLNQNITADVALALAKRAFSALFATGTVTSARIGQLMRHALKPSEM